MHGLAQRTPPESLLSSVAHAAVSRRESLRALALLSMAALPARSVGAAEAGSRPPAAPSGDTVIDVPFSLIRLLLPMDGLPPLDPTPRPIQARNTICFLIGDENRWAGRTDFERHEMAELAFGYILRAKDEDRESRDDGEGPMGPGFRENGDHVVVQGGWRAHKSQAASRDLFDGRFSAKLRYFVENGTLRARCEDLKLDWNGSILEFADGKLERRVAHELEIDVNEKLQTEILDPIAKAIRETQELNMLRARTRLEVVGTTVRLAVATGTMVA
jgi:hypothetical protein